MGFGHLLLYAALALVALWLIAELLLQCRAPLLWRMVALGGFLCVVAGMGLHSVPVIGAGAAGFALGQTFVTLAVKRGEAVGWSLRRADGSLPGALGKVPLLAAATGGAAAAAAVAAGPAVGEVGPVEAGEPQATGEYEEMQEIAADGVYAEQPAAYQQVPEQGYYQQTGYGYQGQQWQQQPDYQYAQGYGQQQPQYQDAYAQQQYPYQDPYAAAAQQQSGWDQQYQQQGQAGQQGQQTGYGYQQNTWNYQQQS